VAERRITAILSTLVSTDLPHLYTATTSEGGEYRWVTYPGWVGGNRGARCTAEADLFSHPPHPLAPYPFAPYPRYSIIPAAPPSRLHKRRE